MSGFGKNSCVYHVSSIDIVWVLKVQVVGEWNDSGCGEAWCVLKGVWAGREEVLCML